MAFYPPSGTCQELTMTTNVQLDYPYSSNVNNVTVTDMIDVSATIVNLSVFLPNSTLTNPGFSITFNNVGLNAFNVVLNDTITTLLTINAGQVITIYLYGNTNPNGLWRIIPFGGGVNGISNLNITSDDDSIVVLNGQITPPSGAVDISLPAIVSTIQALGNYIPGLVVINQANELPWGVVSLNNGTNIVIANPNGEMGDPVIDLNENINIAQAIIGNIIIANDLISNIDENSVLSITSNGSASVINLNSVIIDISGSLTVNNLSVEGSFSSPNVAKAWCRFTNTSGLINLTSGFNVSNVTYDNTNNQYTIIFTNQMGNENYVVFITCSNNNSTPPLQTRIGYDVVRQQGSVVIVLTDASGEILQDIPEGVSVIIFSLN
jgi:hypothetical protein